MIDGKTTAFVVDISSGGTFINGELVRFNSVQKLQDHDRIRITGGVNFVFHLPSDRGSSTFATKYTQLEQLGKGQWPIIYLCVEKKSGNKYAVQELRDIKQQDLATNLSLCHPNLIGCKEIFIEEGMTYQIMDLGAEGDLSECILAKQKLTEDETRKVFLQLFSAVKYLVYITLNHREALS